MSCAGEAIIVGKPDTLEPQTIDKLLKDLAGITENTPQKVQTALETIWKNDLYKGNSRASTDWKSLAEGIESAFQNPENPACQPTIITSVGGYDDKPPYEAGFNIIPALELCKLLKEYGLKPQVIITSAMKYAEECNSYDLEGLSKNWATTLGRYTRIVEQLYPELTDCISFESLLPRGLDDLPESIKNAATDTGLYGSLYKTAKRKNPEITEEQFIKYMLSHVQAFRIWQPRDGQYHGLVVKVGAPSEGRFTKWVAKVIEASGQSAGVTAIFVALGFTRLSAGPPYYPTSEDILKDREQRLLKWLIELNITKELWEATL